MPTVRTLSRVCRDSRKIAIGAVPALGLGLATWAMPTASVGASTSGPTQASPTVSPATCGTSIVASGEINHDTTGATKGSVWLHHTSCTNDVYAKAVASDTIKAGGHITVYVIRNTSEAASNQCTDSNTCVTPNVYNGGSTSYGKGQITVCVPGGCVTANGSTGKYTT
jgi:hypothetical protein